MRKTVLLLLTLSAWGYSALSLELIEKSGFSETEKECEEVTKTLPPFYVVQSSDPSKMPWHENLRTRPSKNSSTLGELAIGTVVTAGESSINSIGTRSYVFVFTQIASPYKSQLDKPAVGLPNGYIYGKSLAFPEAWLFKVENSSIAGANSSEERYFLNDKWIRLKTQNNKYSYLSCCEGDQCDDFPVFSVIDPTQIKAVDEFAAKIDDMAFIKSWIPKPVDEVEFETLELDPEKAKGSSWDRRPVIKAHQKSTSNSSKSQSSSKKSSTNRSAKTQDPPEPSREQESPRDQEPTMSTSKLAPPESLRPQERPDDLKPPYQIDLHFPLQSKPLMDFWTGQRAFGTNRSKGKRKHAGCDLYRPTNEKILAIKKGKVLRRRYFYLGTYALEVKNDDGTVFLYGEVSGKSVSGASKGKRVTPGKHIAYVGDLKGITQSMLHFEMYTGESSGLLTQIKNLPFKRRNDLKDPTSLLKSVGQQNGLY